MGDGGHADKVLEYLDQIKCNNCGRQAVRGARICLDCAQALPVSELLKEAEQSGALELPPGSSGDPAPDLTRDAS